MADRGVIAFLAKAIHIDEIFDVAQEGEGLLPGRYRIRNEGAALPLVTQKRYGRGSQDLAETVDQVHPTADFLEAIRTRGKLVTVIHKERVTYKAKRYPDCLLHLDEVTKLGNFLDIKADSAKSLEGFLGELGLEDWQKITKSYWELREEMGVSRFQLGVWQFHERFADYIMGVVSGTLTPIGFLCATLASGGSKVQMIIALASAGLCDGLSDAVAMSQTTQSGAVASSWKQITLFAKTMVGKVFIPLSFVPGVLFATENQTILLWTCALASSYLAVTALIQAIAQERAPLPSVARILAWGTGAVVTGMLLGRWIPELIQRIGGR